MVRTKWQNKPPAIAKCTQYRLCARRWSRRRRWIWSRSNQIRCTSQQPSSFRVNKWRLGFFFQRGGFETLEVISPLHATCNYAEPSPREVCGNWEIVVAKKALKRWSILKRCALFFFSRKLQHSTPTEQLITQQSWADCMTWTAFLISWFTGNAT